MIKYIDELTSDDLKGKRVLLRLDLNVPIEDGKVADAFRLERAISTVDFLREKEAKIIIIAHLENKEGGNGSLLPVWDYLKGYFKIDFCPTYFTPEAIEKVLSLEDKGVLLFENVRINSGEKENDKEFAKKLSQVGDIYVNDAFSVSHRKHASVVGIPEFLPHYGGIVLRSEIEHLSKVFKPEHPFVFILGGAKFETKLPLIKKYLEKADTVFVGGALANDVFKVSGFEVGTSLVGNDLERFGIEEMVKNSRFKTYPDVTVVNDEGVVSVKKPAEVKKDECIVDCGGETMEEFKKTINNAKTIVWNGPLGNYERGFSQRTEELAKIIKEETEKGATSLLGGGDTIASIQKLDMENKFTFISTGGGAMLDFLVEETLVGIEALN